MGAEFRRSGCAGFDAEFGVVWLQHTRGEQALSELADLHVSTLASTNPVDVISTDRHTVKPWFQGKLPFSFNLPELQNSRFKLIGGRLTYFQQSPGAQLLFEVHKHQISVFIFQNRSELSGLSSGSSLRRKLAFSSETWTEGDLRYFVVGDAGPSDIRDLSELLKSAARL
jgi:anti-sigma factor RsiW